MSDGPDVPGEWDPSGQAEPPAALLRRAISHVEQLLQRLERPGVPAEGEVTNVNLGAAAVGGVEYVPPSSGGDDSAQIEPVVANPVRRISSAAQAEALRVSLNAHEKANRLLAEASAIRAQSASEGEQILVEARELADRMQNEATEEASLYVNRAREEAENLVAQAASEMQRVRDAAHAESERLRAEATAEAQRILATAETDAARLQSDSQSEADNLRRTAQQDADNERRTAQDEADRLRRDADMEASRLRESAKADTDKLRSDAEQLRDSVQAEADRLLAASTDESQRVRAAAERDAEKIRSDAESQARADRAAADEAIRETLNGARSEADQIRVQAREQGKADGEQFIAGRVAAGVAEARAELDVERTQVYELLGTAHESVAETRHSMRDLVDALSRTVGSVDDAGTSLDGLMGRLRSTASQGGVRIEAPPGTPQVAAAEAVAPAQPESAPEERPVEAESAEVVAEEVPAADSADTNERHDAAFDIDTMFSDSEPEQQREDDSRDDNSDGRRPLGLLFGALAQEAVSSRASAGDEELHPAEVEYADVPYRASHTGADKAAEYDRDFWTPGTIKALDWTVERALLDRALTIVLPTRPRSALDFACGTGRVLAELERHADRTVGVDISTDMLAVARDRCVRSELVETDVTSNGATDVGRFDVITAFRFFLNAEPGLRRAVLRWVGEHLEPDGRLVANFHLNPHSLRGLYLQARWRGKRLMPMFSPSDVTRFLADGGFMVEDIQGYEYLPFRREGSDLLAPRLRQRVEDALLARPALRAIAGCHLVVARPR